MKKTLHFLLLCLPLFTFTAHAKTLNIESSVNEITQHKVKLFVPKVWYFGRQGELEFSTVGGGAAKSLAAFLKAPSAAKLNTQHINESEIDKLKLLLESKNIGSTEYRNTLVSMVVNSAEMPCPPCVEYLTEIKNLQHKQVDLKHIILSIKK